MTKLIVQDIVGKNAVSLQSGTKLIGKLSPIVVAGNRVELDFDGVEIYATPFFNSGFAPLLRNMEISEIQKLVNIVNLNELGMSVLNHVIDNAIEFYKDESLRNTLDDI